MIKVRFNLGRGKNYMKWKIQSKSGVEYHSPENVQLIMQNCTLKNNRKLAQRIFDGENKDVCAWIVCESINIIFVDESIHHFIKPIQVDKTLKLNYNPKIAPYWRIALTQLKQTIDIKYSVDNKTFSEIVSDNKNLFIHGTKTNKK